MSERVLVTSEFLRYGAFIRRTGYRTIAIWKDAYRLRARIVAGNRKFILLEPIRRADTDTRESR